MAAAKNDVPKNDIPKYDELPQLETLRIRTSWDVLSAPFGTLGFLEDSSVRDAAHSVASGQVISLSLDGALLDPPLFGRSPTEHSVTETGRNIFEDELNAFNPQSASQWDGLTHIRAREFGFFGGITDEAEARESLGMHHWGQRGIAGRGVLVDIAGHRGADWDPFVEQTIDAEELQAILAAQNTVLQPGDILCLRFGWVEEYRKRRARGEGMSRAGDAFAGISSSDDTVRFLWDCRIAAVAADNPAVESAPGDPKVGSLHRKLIPGLGFALAELLDLDALAASCRARGRFDFLFVSAPLTIVGGASSTANAVAIV